MRRIPWPPVIFMAGILALAAVLSAAQRSGGATPQAPGYDPSTEVTVQGAIQEVKEIRDWMGMRNQSGTHLVLKTAQETIEIHLGPTTYVSAQGMTFAAGDRIEVIGSRVKYGEADAIIAREVKKGDQTLTLRDAKGIPRWSRGRRR
jgi:hypothetical protein